MEGLSLEPCVSREVLRPQSRKSLNPRIAGPNAEMGGSETLGKLGSAGFVMVAGTRWPKCHGCTRCCGGADAWCLTDNGRHTETKLKKKSQASASPR